MAFSIRLAQGMRTPLFAAARPFTQFSQSFLKPTMQSHLAAARSFSACSSKNQTPPDALKTLEGKEQNSVKGTGIFLVPDPEKGVLAWKSIRVANLTYLDTVKRGENCKALKWVPETLMSFAEIQKNQPACAGFKCSSPCPHFCICGDDGFQCV